MVRRRSSGIPPALMSCFIWKSFRSPLLPFSSNFLSHAAWDVPPDPVSDSKENALFIKDCIQAINATACPTGVVKMKNYFYDLNVQWIDDPKQKAHFECTLGALSEYGFRAIALTHTCHGKIPKTPCPAVPTDASLRTYTRLTIVMDDPQQNYGLNAKNAVLRTYDIISVQPMSEKLFQMACQSMDIDLITFDLTSERLPFQLKHGFVREAVRRGVYFELCVGAAFTTDLAVRRNVLANAMSVARITKGKNTIISSGAATPSVLRGPFDLYNLAKLIGIPAHLAMSTVRGCPALLMERVATRKHTNRGIVFEDKSKGDKRDDLLEDFVQFI